MDDPLNLFVPFVGFLMLGVGRYQREVAWREVFTGLAVIEDYGPVAAKGVNYRVLGAVVVNRRRGVWMGQHYYEILASNVDVVCR